MTAAPTDLADTCVHSLLLLPLWELTLHVFLWLVHLMKRQSCAIDPGGYCSFRLLPVQFDHSVRVAGIPNQLDEHA